MTPAISPAAGAFPYLYVARGPMVQPHPFSRSDFRILLVEDNPGDARLVREYLRGMQVQASSIVHSFTMAAAEAELAHGPIPDLILLDLELPDSSGLQTINRTAQAAPQSAVVVLTGSADHRLPLQAIRSGAQDYLPKDGITVDALERVIRYALERTRIERRDLLLAEAGEILAAPMVETDHLRKVGNLLVGRMADWCVIDLLDEEGRREHVQINAADPETEQRLRAMLALYPHGPASRNGPVAQVLETGKPLLLSTISNEIIENAAADEEHLRLIRALAPSSSMIVPMLIEERAIGAITLTSTDPGHPFARTDLAVAEEIGRRTAIAIRNARLYHTARTARERVAHLQRVTAALLEVTSSEDVAAVTLENGMTAVDANSAALAVLNEDGTEFRLLHSIGLAAEADVAWREFPADAPVPIRDAVRTGAPIFIESEAESRRACSDSAGMEASPESRSVAVIPVMLPNDPPAVLVFGFDRWKPFTRDERELLLGIGHQCALGLQRARLHERERAALLARDIVLGIVAHDLRNPLAAISLMAYVMEDKLPDDDPLREQVQKITEIADHANRLIQDLLDVRRLDAGELHLKHTNVPVDDLLTRTADLFGLAARSKDVLLEVRLTEGANVWGDPDRILQVLSNLVGNALRFTPAGGRIVLGAEDQPPEVRFAVSDDGPGIPPEDVPHVFDRYWQAERGTSAGAGLGLAIAKGIVERHRGRISVETSRGAGSTFYFSIPVFAPAEAGE